MSHKTGKRVLTASTSLALAVVGLAASPLAAHAAAGDVVMTDNCGANDTIGFLKNVGTYDIYVDGTKKISVDTATGKQTPPANQLTNGKFTVTGVTASTGTITWQDNAGSSLATTTLGAIDADGKQLASGTAPVGGTTASVASQFNNSYYVNAEAFTFGTGTSLTLSSREIANRWAVSGTPVNAAQNGSTTGTAVAKISITNQTDPKVNTFRVNYLDATNNVLNYQDVTTGSAGALKDAAGLAAGTASSNALAAISGGTTSHTPGAAAPAVYLNGSTVTTSNVPYTPDGTPATIGSATSAGNFNTTTSGYSFLIPANSTPANAAAAGEYYLGAATNPAMPLKSTVVIYRTDGGTAVVTPTLTSGQALTAAGCTNVNAPAPIVSKLNSGSDGGTITVTKGSGVTWSIVSGNTSPRTITFDAAAPASATTDITVNDGNDVIISATPSSGYTGSPQTWTFKLDQKLQVNWVPPVVNDRDGKDSDTVTLTNISGVTYYYKVQASQSAAETANTNAVNSGGGVNDVTVSGNNWTAVASGATSITRPSSMTKDQVMGIVAFTDSTKKFDASGTSKKTATASFTDTTKIKSIPSPTAVDGVGSADYYILPAVPGVKWTVTATDSSANVSTVVYRAGDPRLGQQVPVFTSNPPVSFQFKAEADEQAVDSNSVAGNYSIDTTAVTKTIWTQTFDNRGTVTPAAPQFIDKTGLVDDGVSFPQLQNGLDGYRFALGASGDTQPADGSFKYVDYTWYGKQVSLTDLQRAWSGTPDPSKVKIWVKTKANGTTFLLAKDASGNDVPSLWSYTFTNSVNVVPVAPTQTAVAGDATKYTLTFPVDATVIYSVTDANGVTRDIAYGDLGKPLTYSGTTTVKARAASSIYVIQPKTDGTAPAPWTFMPPVGTVTPQAPTGHDMDGLDGDNYSLPKQDGIIWNVNGVDVDPAKYGTDLKTGGAKKLVIIAQPASGYTLKDGAQTRWELTFTDGPVKPPAPSAPTVNHENVEGADVPTAKVTWSADGAAGYKVTYQKLLGNGERAQELTWFKNTTATSANFVAMPGDKYYVRVAAIGSDGTMSEVKETLVTFADRPDYYSDITTGVGTYGGSWDQLTNLMSKNLPYIKGTAALGYNGSSWTVTLPAGTTKFDLFATVHQYGAAGKIQVNGQNWADFTTNSTVWKQVTDPYAYPVRTIQGWDSSKPVTIKVMITGTREQYVALDAYKAHN